MDRQGIRGSSLAAMSIGLGIALAPTSPAAADQDLKVTGVVEVAASRSSTRW